MVLILEYIFCYMSSYILGMATGVALMNLYYHYKESKQND